MKASQITSRFYCKLNMYTVETKWTYSQVNIIIGAEAPIIIRMNNDEAMCLYNDLSTRAASSDLFNKDGSFTIGDRIYHFTAGQWASIHRTLDVWYEQYFEANIADELLSKTSSRLDE